MKLKEHKGIGEVWHKIIMCYRLFRAKSFLAIVDKGKCDEYIADGSPESLDRQLEVLTVAATSIKKILAERIKH